MDFVVVHRGVIKHQSAEALSILPTTGKERRRINNGLLFRLFLSPPNEGEKLSIETTDVIDDYNDNGFSFISPVLFAVCSFMTYEPETNPPPPALVELLA